MSCLLLHARLAAAPPALLLALLALAAPARAQSAADRYHEAARLYVGGERDAAEAAALAGLQQAPDDPKLNALLERIRQQQEQTGQDEGQSPWQNPNQQGGEQGQQGGEGQQQQDQGEQRRDQDGTNRPEDEPAGAASDHPEQEQPEARPPDQPQEGGREDERGRPDAPRPGEGGPTPETAEAVAPGEMTRAEAERILNAVGAEERLLLRRTQRRAGDGRPVEKDW